MTDDLADGECQALHDGLADTSPFVAVGAHDVVTAYGKAVDHRFDLVRPDETIALEDHVA